MECSVPRRMTRLKWRRALLFITATLLVVSNLLSPVAAAAGDNGGAKLVRVGYVNFENYQEGGEGEYKRGFGYEYLQRIAYSTGWQYEYVYGSFSELLQMLKDGEIDLMGDLSYTEERAEVISFSALPQGRENFYIYTTVDQKNIDPFELDTLNGQRIGVTANSYQQGLLMKWLEEGAYDCTVVEYAGSSKTAAALNSGEVDAMIMTDMASTGGYVPIVSIGYAEFYFGVNRERPDILEDLNRALREIQTTDPYYNEVTYAKYITSSLSNSYLSKQERKWLEEHDNTVRMGYLTGNLPYCDTGDNGMPKGLITALIDTFEQDFNIHVTTTGYATPKEMVDAAADGETDLFGPLYGDFWLSEQYGFFNSNAIASTTFILLYQDDYTQKTTEKIACAKNNAIQRGAAEVLFPDSEYVMCQTKEDCLEAVLSGEATCTIASAATMNHYKQYKAMKVLNMVELPKAVQICMGTLRGNSELLNIINRVIFASTENLSGAVLIDNAHADVPFSLSDYLEEHSLAVILILVAIIALMLAFFLYYHQMTSRLIKMQTTNEELSHQAFRDGLTKVGNRAGYLVAEKDLQLQIDAGEPVEFALLVVDVNGLKTVNDALGHETGDLLIQNTSQRIHEICGRSPVFRIGGDEFVAVLTGVDYEQRGQLLSELRRESLPGVSKQQVEMGLTSMAFGMAEFDREADRTVAEVFARADKAMYACKKQMKQAD